MCFTVHRWTVLKINNKEDLSSNWIRNSESSTYLIPLGFSVFNKNEEQEEKVMKKVFVLSLSLVLVLGMSRYVFAENYTAMLSSGPGITNAVGYDPTYYLSYQTAYKKTNSILRQRKKYHSSSAGS